MLKNAFGIACLLLISACTRTPQAAEASAATTDSTALMTNDTPVAGPDINGDYATYYIVAADTGLEYPVLQKKMYSLSKELNLPIDTLGRYYNKTKNLIVLPYDDEDEIYRGEYFPRRYPSANLSLEYLYFYKPGANNTIVLVAGIYETERTADSALTLLKKAEKNSFSFKADVYIGCMH